MTLHNKTNFSILTGYTLALSKRMRACACSHTHDQKNSWEGESLLWSNFTKL